MDKDIRFTEKKVDESWKEEATKVKPFDPSASSGQASAQQAKPAVKTSTESQKKFINFLMNIATQALYLMGVVEDAGVEKDLGGAQEMIDILKLLKERTEGNLSEQEKKAFEKILYDLQMNFVQVSNPTAPQPPKS